ncbi:hypothetical protein KUTeg_003544 [Tegillarca granosa]|uniref:Uncharacterized protein n=1 Tax=Tegillarca granosa TaxID=220873 RepID=A0ABQ9FMG0_TEGGR|nr:hypothetical protein KUTeg_003544 [Tegillarca granosa]
MKSEHDMHSQEDTGDSSSVDSFTTVVPANEEDQQDDEDRLEDFASMTSSFNSDVHGKVLDEEREKDLEGLLIEWDHKESVDDKWQSKKTDDTLVDWDFKEMTRTMETDSEPPLIEWAESESIEEMKSKHDAPLIDWSQRDINGQSKEKHKDDVRKDDLRGIEEEKEDEDYNGGPLIDWGPREEEGSESSLESDRYEYIDKTALSVITEISDEDRFEMIDKDDLESEIMSDIMSDRPHSSPDYPPAPSPVSKSYDDIDRDSIDGKDDQDLEDSLSEDKKTSKEENLDQAEVDSLEGDVSELTSMTSSVILAADMTGSMKEKDECDADSLHDEAVMKTSGDSLGDESLMKISGDSLGEEFGLKTTKSDKFDTDSLQDQEGIMERSADSLEQDKKSTGADKLETDSLHEHDVMQTSADSLESMELSQKYESVMESSMYSVASSSFSRSSQETMRSAGSHSDSSQDIMQVSTDSWEDKDFIMDNYHQQLDVENMTYDPSVCNVMGGPNFLDYQGNVWRGMTQGNIDNYQWGSRILDYEEEEKTTSASPFLSKGPYEEKKKIFTMTEWEAMKEEKRRASLAKSSEETVEKMEESMESKKMEDSMESRKMEDSMESKKSEDSVDSKKSEDSLESKKMEDSLEMKDESIVMQSDKSDDSTSAS